jgi:putative DNA primase/helicase
MAGEEDTTDTPAEQVGTQSTDGAKGKAKKARPIWPETVSGVPKADFTAWVRQCVEHSRSLGIWVIPLYYHKDPGHKWTQYQFKLSDWKVGVNTGAVYPRSHLVKADGTPGLPICDVDVDHLTWIKLAPDFLPATGARWGRESKPQSHWAYQSDLAYAMKRARLSLNHPKKDAEGKPIGKALEFWIGCFDEKGQDSCMQSAIPPGVHKSGEEIRWEEGCSFELAAEVPGEELLRAYCKLGLAGIIVEMWPASETGHDPIRAIAGWLARLNWTWGEIEHFVRAVAKHVRTPSGDAYDLDELIRNAKGMYDWHQESGQGQGLPTVRSLFGGAPDDKAVELLRLREEVDQQSLIEDELARGFIDRHGHELRFVKDWGWMAYDGVKWSKDGTHHHEWLAREFLKATAPGGMRTNKVTRAVINLARSDIRIVAEPEEFDKDDWLLNTPVGVFDLKAFAWREHDPALLLTKCTAVAPDWDMPTPKWDAFLRRVHSDDEAMIAYHYRLFGYGLTGLTKEESVHFFWGQGGNGKNTETDTITAAMGDYHAVIPMSVLLAHKHEQHPTGLASLAGARLVTANETGAGRTWDEELIKSMTGGGKMKARFMNKDFFEFEPKFTLVVIGNNKPKIRIVDDAIRRRMQLAHFNVTIPKKERDNDLKTKLRDEMSGILAKVIDGCLDWQGQGLNPPQAVLDATAQYLDEQDTFGEFVRVALAWYDEKYKTWDFEKLRKSTPLEHRYPAADVFAAWCTYSRETLNEHPGHARTFNDRMAALGYVKDKNEGGMVWLGVGLTTEGQELARTAGALPSMAF